jgi:AbrB family looped-hinge helix DNA binding protein
MASESGTKLTIDKSGRIVVPKPLRQRLGLLPGTELEIVDQVGGLLLRIADRRPAMTKVEGLWVHKGLPLPHSKWDQVIDDVREERTESVVKARR